MSVDMISLASSSSMASTNSADLLREPFVRPFGLPLLPRSNGRPRGLSGPPSAGDGLRAEQYIDYCDLIMEMPRDSSRSVRTGIELVLDDQRGAGFVEPERRSNSHTDGYARAAKSLDPACAGNNAIEATMTGRRGRHPRPMVCLRTLTHPRFRFGTMMNLCQLCARTPVSDVE
jgi:hypothetical protein